MRNQPQESFKSKKRSIGQEKNKGDFVFYFFD